MTQEVSDEKLGRFARQQSDWFRRVREGSLDPDEVARAVQQIIDGSFNVERIMVDISNAYEGDPQTVQQDVMRYVNIVRRIDDKNRDITTKQKIDEMDQTYIEAVEERLALNTRERKEAFRHVIRKIYVAKRLGLSNTPPLDPNYDFMDNWRLVGAVTNVRLQSALEKTNHFDTDVITAFILGSKANEKSLEIYNRVIEGLIKQGYSRTRAQKAIAYFSHVRPN